MEKSRYQICTNCIMDTTAPHIKFDENGRCDYCNNYYDNILPNWHPDDIGETQIQSVISKIKRDGKGKKHDCHKK